MVTPVPDDDRVSWRLKTARLLSGLTLEAAAERAGVDYTTIWRYEAGQRSPGAIPLFKLARVYRKSVDWFCEESQDQKDASASTPAFNPDHEDEKERQLQGNFEYGEDKPKNLMSGGLLDRAGVLINVLAKAATEREVSLDYLVGLTDDPTPAAQLAEIAHPAIATTAVSRESHEIILGDPQGRRPVELLEVASAAGSGAEVYDETPVGVLWFRNDWLARYGIDPKQRNIISVRGESMEPTLPDGCSILVDRNRRTPREGRIYVMRTEDGMVVKRVGEDRDGCRQMLSDDPAWPPAILLEDTEIIGEVRWTARTL